MTAPAISALRVPRSAQTKRAALGSARAMLTRVMAGVKRRVQAAVADPSAPSITAALTHPPAVKRLATIAHHDAERERISQNYVSALQRCLEAVRTETLARIQGAKPVKVLNADNAAADFPFNLASFRNMFFAEMRAAGTDALQQSGAGMNAELGLDPDQFNTGHGIATKFAINRQNKLKDVPDDIFDQVTATLTEGTNAGEAERQLAQRVAAALGEYENGNAQTIARTETASAYGTGRMDSMQQAGFTYKSWLDAGDDKVRFSHEQCQRQGPIPVDEDFENGLSYPGDPEGDADEVINCRCVLQAEEEPTHV